jgi:CopG family nickel-responsive transcriptional regulator
LSELVRFSVSLEADLLEQFDRYRTGGRFATRSEAIRQLLRETLTQHGWSSGARDAAATLTLVYDHHRVHVSEKLVELQHRHPELIVSTTHAHLDHDHCLEVIPARSGGEADGNGRGAARPEGHPYGATGAGRGRRERPQPSPLMRCAFSDSPPLYYNTVILAAA